VDLALVCERFGDGYLGQAASTVSALGFVVAGLVIILGRAGAPPDLSADQRRFGVLVVAVGVGSVVQHGPHPDWQAYAHDLPLAALLGFVAADAAADLSGRRGPPAWWLVPTAAVVPAVMAGPAASTVAQSGLAAVAIGLSLLRARVRPRLRRTLLVGLGILAAGALAGTFGDRTSLCRPESPLQGHAAWHLLAALALWWLAPVVGSGRGAVPEPAGRAGTRRPGGVRGLVRRWRPGAPAPPRPAPPAPPARGGSAGRRAGGGSRSRR
jgi:hypothetical protein